MGSPAFKLLWLGAWSLSRARPAALWALMALRAWSGASRAGRAGRAGRGLWQGMGPGEAVAVLIGWPGGGGCPGCTSCVMFTFVADLALNTSGVAWAHGRAWARVRPWLCRLAGQWGGGCRWVCVRCDAHVRCGSGAEHFWRGRGFWLGADPGETVVVPVGWPKGRWVCVRCDIPVRCGVGARGTPSSGVVVASGWARFRVRL